MTAFLFFMLIAGQPIPRHARHPTHFSGLMKRGGLCLTVFSSAQGRRAIITDGSSAASSSFKTVRTCFKLKGSTTVTRCTPTALHSASKSTAAAGSL